MWKGQKIERPKNRPVLIEASHRIVHSGSHQLLAVMLPTVAANQGEKLVNGIEFRLDRRVKESVRNQPRSCKSFSCATA